MLSNNFKENNIKNLMQIIFLILISLIFVTFIFLNFNIITDFLSRVVTSLKAIIYGVIMTYIMSPLYNLIVNKLAINKKDSIVLSKIIATTACVIVVLIVVTGLIALVIPQLVVSVYNFSVDFNKYQDKIFVFINKLPFLQELTHSFKDLFDNMSQNIANNLLPKLNTIALNFSMGAMKTFKEIVNFLIGIIVMIYVINMKTSILNKFKKAFYAIFSEKVADKIMEEFRYAHKVFSGFLIGKILDSIIIGIICFICCSALSMPYTLLVSVIVGITNIIPFFGPFIGAIPSFIFIVLVNPLKGIIFLILILILQQFDGNILGPYILGDKTGVESFYVLFSILLFGGLFGFIGMIIGVPLFAVLSRLCWEFLDSRLEKKKLPIDDNKYKDK